MRHEKAIFLDVFLTLGAGGQTRSVQPRSTRHTLQRWMRQRQTLSCGEVSDGAGRRAMSELAIDLVLVDEKACSRTEQYFHGRSSALLRPRDPRAPVEIRSVLRCPFLVRTLEHSVPPWS